MLPKWYSYRTHCVIKGGAQKGKTSFAVMRRRRHIRNDTPIVSLDFKSGGFEQDCAFISEAYPTYPVFILNPSDPTKGILGYNPFELRKGRDLSVRASRITGVLLSVTTGESIKDLPTFRRIANLFNAHLAVSRRPVHAEIRMFDFENRQLWIDAAPQMPDQQIKDGMLRLPNFTASQWEREVLAAKNRYDPFTMSSLRRFTGVPSSVSIADCFLNGISLLVNATPSAHLSGEAAKIFLGLILSDILQVGIENATNPHTLLVYADEIQEYCPPDFGSVLDLSIASGIRITAIHHHDGQMNERVRQSLDTNAGIKVIFDGLPWEEKLKYARMAWMKELNLDMRKQPRISYVTEYDDEFVESTTESEFGDSITYGSRLHPRSEEVITGWEHYSMEEKLSKLAARFNLKPRTCMVILPDKTKVMEMPTLGRYLYNSANCLGVYGNPAKHLFH